jgi:hypothetical protein
VVRFNESGPVEELAPGLDRFLFNQIEGKRELVMVMTYSSFCRRAIMISEAFQFVSPMRALVPY